MYLFWIFCINAITQHVTFCICLLSPDILFWGASTLQHASALSFHGWKIFHCMDVPHFIHSSVDGRGNPMFNHLRNCQAHFPKGCTMHSHSLHSQPCRVLVSPHPYQYLQCFWIATVINSMWTDNFQIYRLDLEKAEEPQIKLPTSIGS